MTNSEQPAHPYNEGLYGSFSGLSKKEHASIEFMKALLSNPNQEIVQMSLRDKTAEATNAAISIFNTINQT